MSTEHNAGDLIHLPFDASQEWRAALLARGLDYVREHNELHIVPTQFAAVDLDGRFDTHAQVYFASANRGEVYGWAKRNGCQVIERSGSIVGERVLGRDIGSIFRRVAS